jgi:iron complex transport system permease protein
MLRSALPRIVPTLAAAAPRRLRRPATGCSPRGPQACCPRPASALVVAAADLAARRLFSPDELPAGVLTAAVGAPVLLFLLVRVSRRSD